MLSFAIALAFLSAAPSSPPDAANKKCIFDDDDRASAAHRAYFRKSLWPCEGDWHFYSGWYGEHLETMSEPSFANATAIRGYSARYRLLVLPSFKPAYSVRIDFLPNKTDARVTVVTESGAGGYGPGKKVPLWSFEMNPRLAQDLSERADALHLDSQPLKLPNKPNGPDDEIVICADGTKYVLEYLDSQGRQRVVARHNCDFERDPKLVELFERFIHIGRLTVPHEVAEVVYRADPNDRK